MFLNLCLISYSVAKYFLSSGTGGSGCGIFILGDAQNLTGHGPEQPALVDFALSTGSWTRQSPEVLPSNLNDSVSKV